MFDLHCVQLSWDSLRGSIESIFNSPRSRANLVSILIQIRFILHSLIHKTHRRRQITPKMSTTSTRILQRIVHNDAS